MDLVFTTNPSLIKSTANAPGISDHAMVVTDTDIKPQYTFCKPRKLFKFGKANWQEIKKSCSDISNHVMEQVKSSSTNIENLWTYFKTYVNIQGQGHFGQRSFFKGQVSGERSQDQWSSGYFLRLV